METLLIKVKEPDKANLLMQVLKSMDFIDSVDYFEGYKKAKNIFDEINKISSKTDLVNLSMEDIISEIKAYRSEKKLRSH
ncbi:MAG: hypothetical protein ACKVOQ_15525 [Cyclobacteriaceae bacterium]